MEPRTTGPTASTSSSATLSQWSTTDVPRFGLETEMHGLLLTFKRTDTADVVFWPAHPKNSQGQDIRLGSTMVGAYPILVPYDGSTYRLPGAGKTDADVDWTSFWGFRAVADSFLTLQFGRQPVPDQYILDNIAGCALELQTPAQDVSDADYWVFVRRCLQAFRNTMTLFSCAAYAGRQDLMVLSSSNDRWFPLGDFLDMYNASVDAIQAPAGRPGWPRDKFKLRVSDHLTKLAGGTSETDGKWVPFFSIKRNFSILVRPPNTTLNHPQSWAHPSEPNMAGLFSDVQLTYDLNLSTLLTNMEAWQNLWGSTWLVKATKITNEELWLDPANGTERWKKTPMPDVYAIQTFRALWGVAIQAAGAFVQRLQTDEWPSDDAVFHSTLAALVAYVFVAGSIKYRAGLTSTAKNAFPQLPKTAPASVARELAQLFPHCTAILQDLSGNFETQQAQNHWIGYLESMTLPSGGPCEGAPTYDDKSGAILLTPLGTLNDAFTDMWKGTFDLKGTAADYANAKTQKGFCSDRPFFVFWASDAQSSKGAVTTKINTKSKEGKVTTTTGVKILMESRYSSSILNQGFNAYATDAMFKQSYLSLVKFMAPETLPNVETAVAAYFPGAGPRLQQIFPQKQGGGLSVH